MNIVGLTTDPIIQRYLHEVHGLEIVSSASGLPLFKRLDDSHPEYFLGGYKSFYTLLLDDTLAETDVKINEAKKKYKRLHYLISTSYPCTDARLVNYVLETKGLVDVEDRLDLYHKKTRNLVRKSYKNNFAFHVGDQDDRFYDLYRRSIGRLGGIPKTHSWFATIGKYLPENIVVLSLFDGDKMVASNFCLVSRKYILLMFNISDPEYWEYAVNDRLYDELVKWSILNNLDYVDFGPSVRSDASHNHFKAGFGARCWYILEGYSGDLWYRVKSFIGTRRHNLKIRWGI